MLGYKIVVMVVALGNVLHCSAAEYEKMPEPKKQTLRALPQVLAAKFKRFRGGWEQRQAYLTACRSPHNLAAVQHWLNEGSSVHERNDFGNTALHIAAACNDIPLMRLLLRERAHVDVPGSYKLTPLHFAAQWGHVDAAGLLCEKGACIDACSQSGQTPFFQAASFGHAPLIYLLATQGASLARPDGVRGMTPLHAAVEGGRVEAVRALLQCGASVRDANRQGKTVLQLADDLRPGIAKDQILQLLAAHAAWCIADGAPVVEQGDAPYALLHEDLVIAYPTAWFATPAPVPTLDTDQDVMQYASAPPLDECEEIKWFLEQGARGVGIYDPSTFFVTACAQRASVSTQYSDGTP